jgi:ketosteroid isomerase-like protein
MDATPGACFRIALFEEEPMPDATVTDVEVLNELNDRFMRSIEASDVRWFREHLGAEFMNRAPDGTLEDRAAFLERIARPAGISDFGAHDVRIQVLGDFAIIHGRTRYIRSDGQRAGGWYTDIWARRDGRWQCVGAHVNRG